MSTAHSSATIHAPARVARAPEDAAPAKDSLWEHARRSFRATEGEVAASLLNPLIDWLLRLRKWAGAAPDTVAETEEDRPGSRQDRDAGRPHAAAHKVSAQDAEEGGKEEGGKEDEERDESETPGKRRLFTFLVYLCLVLAGSMSGVAIAYNLLENLLAGRSAETVRMGATIEKQAKSIVMAEKKLEEAQSKVLEAEKKLDESGIAAIEKKLEEAQAKRLDVEKILETTLAESAKAATEKQKRLDEAVKVLGTIVAAERAGKAQRSGSRGGASSGDSGSAASSNSASSKTPAPKGGDCTLSAGNIAATLKDCVADFKR